MPKYPRGVSGNPHGRPAGIPNKATTEGRELAQKLVSSASYRRELKARLLAGKLHPLVERHLWELAYGRPAQSISVTTDDPVRDSDAFVRASVTAKLEQFLLTVPPAGETPAPDREVPVDTPAAAPAAAGSVELLPDDTAAAASSRRSAPGARVPLAPADAPVSMGASEAPASGPTIRLDSPRTALAERLSQLRRSQLARSLST